MITENPFEKSDSPKCQTLIDAGRKLFWKHGFRRVTVDEICREADVSKMTFYRCFENKTELAKSIFDKEVKKGISSFNEIIKSDIPATEKLHKIISMKMEGTNDISQEFLADFYINPDLDLKIYVEEVTRKSWKEVVEGFRYAQDQGWFRKDFKPEFLFYIAQQIIPMCTDKELLRYYDKPQDLILEFANFFTYGILPHD